MKAITQLKLNLLHKVDALLKVSVINIFSFVFSLLMSFTSFICAQDSNHLIAVNQLNVDASILNIQPGDTVCIQAGVRGLLRIANFHGTPEKYIVFKNFGGEVIIQGDDLQYGVSIVNSSYFRFTGTGIDSIKYGIRVMKTKVGGTMGIGISDRSTNYEIDHIEIANVGFAGIMAKTDPKNDLSTNRDNFTQYQSIFHDNYIHNTGGEGMYIGHSFYNGILSTSVGDEVTLLPSVLKGVRVYNNRVDSTGWDGIQVGSATEDCEIYGNSVTNYGVKNVSEQQSGIQLGGGTTGKCFNNYIANGSGNGISVFGLGNNDIYNNIILNAGRNNFPNDPTKRIHGIFVQDISTIPGSSFNFYNNTIINPKTDGIRFSSVLSKNNKFQNNIILNPGSFNTYSKYSKETSFINIGVKIGIDAVISNNFFDINSDKIKFEDEKNNNFKLLSNSPAIEAGLDLSNFGINCDFDNNARPIGRSFDIGAYQRISRIKTNLDSKSILNYNVYPNPSNGKFHISREESSNITISIHDIMGKVVKTSKNTTDKLLEFDITDIAANGKYFVTFNDEYASITKTIIIQ